MGSEKLGLSGKLETGEGELLNLVMAEVEPELEGLRQQSRALEHLPDRSPHLGEGVERYDRISREHKPARSKKPRPSTSSEQEEREGGGASSP